jgi:hypothetical protein
VPPDPEELPLWPEGTAAVLCVAGPHAIPVSTAVRVAPRRIVIALGGGRETLTRLREEPAVALCVMAEGLAFTAYGRASIAREGLEAAPRIVAVRIDVERVQDHLADGRTEMQGGAPWRWIDAAAAETDPKIRAELSGMDE